MKPSEKMKLVLTNGGEVFIDMGKCQVLAPTSFKTLELFHARLKENLLRTFGT